jgi:ABC-type branched-subunit amino acid transport system substrate-binding protein
VSLLWQRRWSTRRKVLTAATTMAAVAAIGYGAYSLQHYVSDADATCMNAAPTIVTHEGPSGECVGVTDGSYQFEPGHPALVGVEDKIKAEDQWVRRTGKSYVSVAYLMPAVGGVDAENTFEGQLEGAYTAEHYANHGGNVQGTSPLIQLLIASIGVNADQYPVVDAEIVDDVASQHLVAAAGIAISLDNTLREVKDLTADKIPVFGSTPTSDQFDNIPGFVRVSPSNKQEIDAVLSYVRSKDSRAFLIEDTNPSDIYDTSISDEFQADFPDPTHSIVDTETYDSAGEASLDDRVGQQVSNRISQMSLDICVSGADVVLYGGRGRDLTTLVGDLASRPCGNRPVTIVSGDDASNVPASGSVVQGLRSGVSVYYATEVDPGEWARSPGKLIVDGTNVYNQAQQGYAGFTAVAKALFGVGTASQRDVAMGYDAMLTCISAAHLAGEANPAAVTAGSMDDELSALQGGRTVFGASGPIDLSGVYTGPGAQGSNPVMKAVPILRLSAPGEVAFVELQQASAARPGS